jgi:hypothetical protein
MSKNKHETTTTLNELLQFDEDDLLLNSQLKLSTTQIEKLRINVEEKRNLTFFCLTIIIGQMIFAGLFPEMFATPLSFWIGTALIGLGCVALWRWNNFANDLSQQKVVIAEADAVITGSRGYSANVGSISIDIQSPSFPFIEGEFYRIYYLQNSRTPLSAERIMRDPFI